METSGRCGAGEELRGLHLDGQAAGRMSEPLGLACWGSDTSSNKTTPPSSATSHGPSMFKPPQELIWISGYFIKHNFQYCPLIFLWSRKINLNWLQDSVFTFCYRKLGAYTLMIQKRTCRNPSFCNSCSSMRGRQ